MDDSADLAAKRVLSRLVDTRALELSSTRGVSAMAGGAARFLLDNDRVGRRAARFAEWLIDQPEVADLFAEDELIERVLAEAWDGVATEALSGVDARNPEFEQSLIAAPDDPERYLVYGDWLQAEGDIHGELIARQVAASAGDRELARAAGTVLETNAGTLLGPLAGDLHKTLQLEWQFGFVRLARLARDPADPEPHELSVCLDRLLSHRVGLLVRELELVEPAHQDTNRLVDAVSVLVRLRPT